MSQKILSQIIIIILAIINISLSLQLTPPIQAKSHTVYTFNLTAESKYIIYSFQNGDDITDYEIVFRFNTVPKYSSKFFVYYSKNDISGRMEDLITYDSETGEFLGSIYSLSLNSIDQINYEIALNSSNCDSQYLKPGYFYAVISIVSTGTGPEYSGEFVVFNTLNIPEISISNPYDYYKVGGPYKNYISFVIPTLSKDILLKLNVKSSLSYTKNINIYQNSLEGDLFNSTSFTYQLDAYYKLKKGYSYYIQCKNDDKPPHTVEFLFQFPSSELMKLEEGKTIILSSIIDTNLYFYLSREKMKNDDIIYIQNINNVPYYSLSYIKLDSDDYDYIYKQKNSYFSVSCSQLTRTINGISTTFYNCKTIGDYKAVLFKIRITKDSSFTVYHLNLFSKKNIINSDNFYQNFQKGTIGYYSLNLKDLSSFNKNILIYSNTENALGIYCSDFEVTDAYYYSRNEKYYENIRLYFLDPSNPEVSKNIYTIFIYNPSLEDYSLDIKFIDKNINFIKEFSRPLEEYIIRKSYYLNDNYNSDIYQSLTYVEKNEEKVENYAIIYHELYGNFDTEMIILDNINVKTIDEFLNDDFSFNKKYVTTLSDCSILGKYIFTHIKLYPKEYPKFYDHIALYQNIIKMITSNSIKLAEGEEIRLFPKKGEQTFIYFSSPYTDFNFEIKFIGRANSSKFNVSVFDCENNRLILDYKSKIIRGRCANVDAKTKITLINEGTALTGIIVKRALPKENFKKIISDSLYTELTIGKDLSLLKFEKNLASLYYFTGKISLSQDSYTACLYQDYSDINYISLPPKNSCFNKIDNFSSYGDLSVDYDLIYNETNARGKLIDSDYLYVIFNSSKPNTNLRFKKIFKLDATGMETKDFVNHITYDGAYYIMPRKTLENNYDSIFIQVSKNYYSNYGYDFKFYKDNELLSSFSGTSRDYYGSYDISQINVENQFYLYTEHNTNSNFRFKLYNSQDTEFSNYNYKDSLYTPYALSFSVKDKYSIPCKVEIMPKYPHEKKGCSNYYLFVLKPEYTYSFQYQTYYDFKILNSSVFFRISQLKMFVQKIVNLSIKT